MENKRGQGLQISTVILLILGVLILIALIYWFSSGSAKLLPWLSSENIDTLKTQCGVACSTASKYAFCSQNRTVNDGTTDEYEATCYELANNHPEYGIEKCPSIDCSTSE